MKLARVSILPGIAATLLILFDSAQACTCMAPASPAEAFEKASAAFTGKVTKIYQSLWDAAGFTRTGNHRVKFEVTKQWKGPRARSIVVVTRLTGEACGFPFEEKKEYLVYVASGPSNIETGICTGTKSIVGAEPEMEQLDRLVSKSSKLKPYAAGPVVAQGITVHNEQENEACAEISRRFSILNHQ